MSSNPLRHHAFTLIELLIVVAIIAILAAIAVPNFLEAQTRSKVSRCAADMRSIRVALESYRVDTNKYPETDIGNANYAQAGVGMIRTTTPISYITTIPLSPFKEQNIGYPGWPGSANRKNANKFGHYLYNRALAIGAQSINPSNPGTLDNDYRLDRQAYLYGAPVLTSDVFAGFWQLKSVGPNNIDDRDSAQTGESPYNARLYDPTNGTVSKGDMVQYQDTFGFATPK